MNYKKEDFLLIGLFLAFGLQLFVLIPIIAN